jgi:ketosteroid isomerase-like protein
MITEAEVHTFLRAYEAAANSRDFAQVEQLIHPDATYRLTDGDFVGLTEIRQAFEKTWAYGVEDERYWLTGVRVIYADSNSACLTYDFHWTGVGSTGPFRAEGRGTQLLVRSGDRLLSMYEHLSR